MTNIFKIYPASFGLSEDQGIFSFSFDFLKEGEALKAVNHGKLVCISSEKIHHLNNHNWLKANDVGKKHIGANLSMLLNYQIKDYENRVICDFFGPKEMDE